jgi:gliding motility-associated-like protein
MLKYLKTTVCFIILSYSCFSQSKMNFPLIMASQDSVVDKDMMVPMLIQGNVSRISILVEEVGGLVKYTKGDITSVTISINQLKQIITTPHIKRVEAFPPKAQPFSDSVLCNNNVKPVHNGQSPLPQAYDGAGVILGFIDTGIDFNHPDFKDSQGNSRILWIWDQRSPVAPNTPMPYGYGQEWSNADIDNNLCTHNPSASNGHGTHVAGIASGNGAVGGRNLGTAPAADIIMVAYNSSFADGVDYIYAKALLAGKPCVINISYGSNYGMRDGRDLESKTIKNLITAQPGRALVAAAGNSGNINNPHLAYTVSSVDTNFTFFRKPAAGNNIYMNIVADSSDLKDIYFSFGADKMNPSHSFRGNVPFVKVSNMPIQTLVNTSLIKNTKRIGQVMYYLDTAAGVYSLDYFIIPDSTTYNWRLMATGSGKFDLWNFDINNAALPLSPIVSSGLPTSVVLPSIVNYKYPDKDKTIAAGFQCLDEVITVGSYVNRKSYVDCNGVTRTSAGKTSGQLENISSIGPTRDGRIKPDITSPGDNTLGAVEATFKSALIGANKHFQLGEGCMHSIDNGTSNACPGVAGIAALYLQKNPTATYAQINQAIKDGAIMDAFTGYALPDKYWGYGKANALATMLDDNSEITHPSDVSLCENSDAYFTADFNSGGVTYQWQVNQGSGFTNISNNPPYDGAMASTLTISATPISYNGYTYRCLIGNYYTCKNIVTNAASLTVNALPSITSLNIADTVCYSTNAQTSDLTYSATNNTPTTYSIVWNPTAIVQNFTNVNDAPLLTSPITIAVPANAVGTSYTGTLTVKNAFNCVSSPGNIFTLEIDPLPVATAGGSTIICVNSSATVGGATAANGTILWSENSAGSITSGETTLTPVYSTVAADGDNNVILTMTVTSDNKCNPAVQTAFYTIQVDSLPNASPALSQTICAGSAVVINGALASDGLINWSENGAGSITSGQGTLNPTYTSSIADVGNTVTLFMTLTSTNACSPAQQTVQSTVLLDPLPVATAGSIQSECEDIPITVSGASAANGSIAWFVSGAALGTITSGATSISPVYTPSAGDAGSAITLTLTVTSNNSCNPAVSNAVHTLNISPPPSVTIGGLQTNYCFNASEVTLSVTPSGGIFSGPGITNTSAGKFNPMLAGTGKHTIVYNYIDANGCSAVATIETTVLPEPIGLDSCTTIDLSSNVFTPNDDGINDVFYFDFKGSKNTYSGAAYGSFIMRVFNRYGNVIYEGYSPKIGWDGTSNAGENQVSGTYFYVVEFSGNTYKGLINLIR